MERNDPCWCGSGKKYKKCHMPIEEKIKLHRDRGEIVPSRKLLKTPAQIEKIKKSAALNTAVLDEVAAHIRAGMSTAEIDKIVYDFTTAHGGIPAPLNYQASRKVYAPLSIMKCATESRMKTSSCRRVISSTSMYLPFWTAISLMHPVCS